MEAEVNRNVSVMKYVVQILYPKLDPFIFILNLIIKYIVNEKRLSKYKDYNFQYIGLIPKQLPKNLHKIIVKNILKDDYCKNNHQIIIPYELFNDLYTENLYYRDKTSLWVNMKIHFKIPTAEWMKNEKCQNNLIRNIIGNKSKMKTSNEANLCHQNKCIKVIERVVQIIPADIHENIAYAEENEVFNWIKPFNYRKFAIDNLILKFSPIKNQNLAPKIAKKLVVEMINLSKSVGTDLTHIMLEQYFCTPKFLHENDVFEIPFTEKYMKHLYFQSEHLTHFNNGLFFKCKTIKGDQMINSNSSSMGYFVIKGETEVLQDQNINSFIPSRVYLTINDCNIENNIEFSYLKNCPYGLENHIFELQKAILPFLLDKQLSWIHEELKCTLKPMFLIRRNYGSGIELLINTLAKQNGLNYITIQCRQLTSSSTAKQTEAKIEVLLQNAKTASPVIVYLEDFEEFGVDGENNEDVRIVENFTIKLQELFENFTKLPIIIFAGCQSNTDLKSNIRRLFLEEFEINLPNRDERFEILKWIFLSRNINMYSENYDEVFNLFDVSNERKSDDIENIKNIEEVDLKPLEMKHNVLNVYQKESEKWQLNSKLTAILYKIASKIETFTFEDLDLVINLALRKCHVALKNIQNQRLKIEHKHFVREIDLDSAIDTLRSMQNKKLTALKIPKVQWDAVGGLDDLKKEIYRTIELPLKLPHLMASSGLKRSGILLWGPPGCGKTLVARAIASQLNANFLSVKGPELLDMYVGQSEKNMRDIFSSARSSAPCVIFFDEAEAAAGARGASGDSGGAADRLVSQLLAELDGVSAQQTNSQSDAVIVIAATNRPDLVEPALLRPGRLDKLLYVGPYNGREEKIRVLKASSRDFNLCKTVDLEFISDSMPVKCTGADLAAIVKQARHNAVSRIIYEADSGDLDISKMSEKNILITSEDFSKALTNFSPSISPEEMFYYESLKTKLC